MKFKMEIVQSWTKQFVLENHEACLEKLRSLSPDEREALRQNLRLNENNKIVLLNGMITDNQEPEFYCEKYEVKSLDGNLLRVESGKYSDKLNINENESADDLGTDNLNERHIFLVTLPASTNQWVYDAESQAVGSNKRKLDQVAEPVTSYTVKIYEKFEAPINTFIEAIGFLSVTKVQETTDSPMETDGFAEPAPAPFTIHAVVNKILPHNNPLLLNPIAPKEEYSREEIRKDLLKLFTQFLFGDVVAANYLLLHLISNVYARVSGEVLGKFSINLTCSTVPKEVLTDHIKKLYNLIELIIPNSTYLPLTIENLNDLTFIPKKDYKTNRLQSGFLQLPNNTHLVLDETKLEAGKLEQSGCLAVADFSELIKSQEVQYDFQFYKIPFHTNIPVLILSEGKSLLPSDFIVPIKPDDDLLRLINENVAAGMHFIKPKLNVIRQYLTECRFSEFKIDETETKMIEEDFVKMREEKKLLEVEYFHSLLVVSRLVGVSKGLTALDQASWEAAKQLEFMRMARVEKKTVNEA